MAYAMDEDQFEKDEQIRKLEDLLREGTQERLALRRRLEAVRDLIMLVCQDEDMLGGLEIQLKLVADYAHQPEEQDKIPF